MGKVIPISRVSHVEVTSREYDRKLARRDMYRRRRQALLWRPLATVGAVLLVWQVTSDIPIPVLVYLGILMLVPTVVDV
jgi:hypothetical protein